MGRSCGHCCGCCECIKIIERFSLKLGEYKRFDLEYFTEEIELDNDGKPIIDEDTGLPKRTPRCKVAKVMNGYSVSKKCGEEGVSDKNTNCRSDCSGAERYWYIIEEDSCKVHRQGKISCDGAFLDFDPTFRYAVIENNIIDGVFEEPFQIVPTDCDLYGNFSFVTCCSDPNKKSSFPDDSLCELSISKPICESCNNSALPIATKTLTNRNHYCPGCGLISATIWDLYPYFNVVGMADKLYNTYAFSYDGKCPVSCNDTNTMMGAANGLTLVPNIVGYDANGNPIQHAEPYTRNYRRFWAIHEYPIISPLADECCGIILKGEIDEHGRLLPPLAAHSTVLPDTCEYCIDGSWHCDPQITVRFAGPINNEDESVQDVSIPIRVSDIVSTDGLGAGLNDGIPIFCCGRRGNIAFMEDVFRDTPIYVWRPHYLPAEEGEDPFDITKRKIEFRLEPTEPSDNLHLEIILRYKTESGPEKYLDSSMATAAYFEMELSIYTDNYILDMIMESQRICPTTDGKIDCNVLNGTEGLIFDKIVRYNVSVAAGIRRAFDSQGYTGPLLITNLEEVQSIVTSSLTVMKKAKKTEILADHCITKDTLKATQITESGFKLIWEGEQMNQLDPIFQNNALAKTFALSICCCDTNHVVALNRDLPEDLRTEIGCAGLTPTCEETTEAGIRCRCTQFDPVIMCSFSRKSELAVIIIDESLENYGVCLCSENVRFNQDLAFFREEAPDTDIVIVQPTIGYGKGRDCGLGDVGMICGGCPLPDEVIDYRNNVRRSDPEGTFDLLKTIFYLHVQGGLNYTGNFLYSAMNIYRDTSGSTRDFEFAAGTKLFLDWMAELYPDYPVKDTTFPNERWLLYAAQSKSGIKCFARYTGAGCNSHVKVYGDWPNSTTNTF
jgi:hypothetical protein